MTYLSWVWNLIVRDRACFYPRPNWQSCVLTATLQSTLCVSAEPMNERMSERMNDSLNEWVSDYMNEWANEWMNECMDEWMITEWMNVWMNEWVNEWMNEWIVSTSPPHIYVHVKARYLCSLRCSSALGSLWLGHEKGEKQRRSSQLCLIFQIFQKLSSPKGPAHLPQQGTVSPATWPPLPSQCCVDANPTFWNTSPL